jgi:hypothetical protein
MTFSGESVYHFLAPAQPVLCLPLFLAVFFLPPFFAAFFFVAIGVSSLTTVIFFLKVD